MNLSVMDGVAKQFKTQATAVTNLVRAVDQLVETSQKSWRGHDSAQFAQRWRESLRPASVRAGSDLGQLGELVAKNVQQQRATSDTLEGAAPGGGAGGSSAPTGGREGGRGDSVNDAAGPKVPLNSPVRTGDRDLERDNIRQGMIGDCWFLSGLGAVSGQDPEFIRQHITQNADGSYTVTMYDHKGQGWFDGDDRFEEVKVTVPAAYFKNGVKDAKGDPSWASIYEAAAAQHRGGEASDINGGWGKDALEMITGRPASTVNDPALTDIQNGLKDGRMYTVGSNADLSWWPLDGVNNPVLVANHEYMIDEVAEKDGELKIHLRNPWGSLAQGAGKAEDIWLTEKEFHDNFGDVASVAGK